MPKERAPYYLKAPIRGKVTARKCDHCGHHEMGIETDQGGLIALKPGMVVEILGGREILEIRK
jgi:hypothetical protein